VLVHFALSFDGLQSLSFQDVREEGASNYVRAYGTKCTPQSILCSNVRGKKKVGLCRRSA